MRLRTRQSLQYRRSTPFCQPGRNSALGPETRIRATGRLDRLVTRSVPLFWSDDDEMSFRNAYDSTAITFPFVPQLEDQGFAIEQGYFFSSAILVNDRQLAGKRQQTALYSLIY